jgi:hypothetical protein
VNWLERTRKFGSDRVLLRGIEDPAYLTFVGQEAAQ